MLRLLAELRQRLWRRARPAQPPAEPTLPAQSARSDQAVRTDRGAAGQTVRSDRGGADQTVRPVQRAADPAVRSDRGAADQTVPPPTAASAHQTAPVPRPRTTVVPGPPGRGRHLVYAPELDGRADPGEIVWTWVAYEEDPTRGKDRPVLVVGRDGDTLLGLMLSSNSDRNGQRHWYALGPGPWDRQRRPSWVRLDRVLLVPEDGIRREGCVLDRDRFEAVAAVLRRSYAWS